MVRTWFEVGFYERSDIGEGKCGHVMCQSGTHLLESGVGVCDDGVRERRHDPLSQLGMLQTRQRGPPMHLARHYISRGLVSVKEGRVEM